MQVITAGRSTDQKRSNLRLKGSKTDKSGSATARQSSPFMQILQEVLPPDDAALYDLHSLWSQLPDAEKRLLNHPSDGNLYDYRNIVKKIAAATLKKNVRLKKIKRKNSRGELVELSIVDIIDERLQQMAIMMHSAANSAFALLKAVEEIRGLLIDVRD